MLFDADPDTYVFQMILLIDQNNMNILKSSFYEMFYITKFKFLKIYQTKFYKT